MDEISLLVAETYKHFHHNYVDKKPQVETEIETVEEVCTPETDADQELPTTAGVLYHLQKSTSVFVIRTLVSENIRDTYQKVLENPADYPSLRLSIDEVHKLRFFMADSLSQAEIIHDQLNNRRFPIDEESMCNLSDPGFSWWLSKKEGHFQVAFNLVVHDDQSTVKLGPLGDQQLASKSFVLLSTMLQEAGLNFEIQNETNRIQFAEGEEVLMEEFQDLFEFGVVGQSLTQLFKFLARKEQNSTMLETTWYYLQELAHVRRFWIQVQYDLSALSA